MRGIAITRLSTTVFGIVVRGTTLYTPHLRAYLAGTRECYYILYPMANCVQDVAVRHGNASVLAAHSSVIGGLHHNNTVFLRDQQKWKDTFEGT